MERIGRTKAVLIGVDYENQDVFSQFFTFHKEGETPIATALRVANDITSMEESAKYQWAVFGDEEATKLHNQLNGAERQ